MPAATQPGDAEEPVVDETYKQAPRPTVASNAVRL